MKRLARSESCLRVPKQASARHYLGWAQTRPQNGHRLPLPTSKTQCCRPGPATPNEAIAALPQASKGHRRTQVQNILWSGLLRRSSDRLLSDRCTSSTSRCQLVRSPTRNWRAARACRSSYRSTFMETQADFNYRSGPDSARHTNLICMQSNERGFYQLPRCKARPQWGLVNFPTFLYGLGCLNVPLISGRIRSRLCPSSYLCPRTLWLAARR
jgi:hypothetical protein